jgi:DNA-binding CsgD family transcriptional regulator
MEREGVGNIGANKRTQSHKLNVMSKGEPVSIRCKEVDTYWEEVTIGGNEQIRHTTLYQVTAPNYNAGFENTYTTTKYGIHGLWRSLIIPGWGQFHKGSNIKGSVFLGGTAVLAGGIVYCQSRVNNSRKLAAQTHNADHIRIYQNRISNFSMARNVCIGGAAALYIWNLVDAIVDFQTEKRVHEIRIEQLTQANHRLWLTVALAISLLITAVILAYLFYQKNKHKQQMKKADEMLTSLVKKLDESNSVKEKTAQEIKEFLSDKEKRQELETLTPYVLKESGETKFRQCFEMLHPLFLHRLHERVPSVTRREELLSMLIVLKQDNKKIAELLAIAPRSVLMLRHRFRQKIGMDTEYSLENFLDQILGLQD